MKKQKIILSTAIGVLALLLIPCALLVGGVISLPTDAFTPVSKVTDPVGLLLSGFELVDGMYIARVNNDVEQFDFENVVSIANGSRYSLSGIASNDCVEGSRAILSVGNNDFYIGVTNGERSAVYTVRVRRLPLYTISFNTRGGSEIPPLTLQEGEVISVEQPILEGHEFSCWLNGTESFDLSQGVTSELCLTALWLPKTYTVSYVSNIGDFSDTQAVTYNSFFTPILLPESELYSFCGWYLGDQRVSEQAWKWTEDITLTAKWIYKAIVVENGVVTSLTDLGKTLSELTIPCENGTQLVTAIADKAFSYNQKLERVTLPSLERVGEQAFYGCGKLSEITALGSLKQVGREAFAKTLWLDNLDNGCVYLGSCLVTLKGDYSDIIYLNENTISVADYAFDGKGIIGVVFNSGLRYVGAHAFEYCTLLQHVSVNDSLLSIGDFAFYGCASLVKPDLPPNVSVGKNVFDNTQT